MITYLETKGLYGHIIDVDNIKAIIKPTYKYVKPVKKEKLLEHHTLKAQIEGEV